MLKYSETVKKIAKALPFWAWTILLILTGAFRSLFVAEMTFNGYGGYISASVGTFVVLLFFLGVAYAFIARIAIRIIYSLGSRLYFRNTAFVPDYNLRRLPVGYNDFCALGMFAVCVMNLFSLALNLLTYAAPTAYYLWLFIGALLRLGVMAAVWFVIRAEVADWQVKTVFLALGIPSMLVLILSVFGGV